MATLTPITSATTMRTHLTLRDMDVVPSSVCHRSTSTTSIAV